MARRGGNNVTGPTSALTSFLREHGITARQSYGGGRPTQEPAEPEENREVEAGPSQTAEELPPASGYESDNLDESPDELTTGPKKKKRKLSKTAEAAAKAKAKAAFEKSKRGKKESDDDDDDDNDPYKALSKGDIMSKAVGGKPPAGMRHNCAQCGKKFTVTQYTISNATGWLCHPCAKASGTDPFSKKAQPRKRKSAAEKRVVQNFEDVEPVRSLTSICITIIGKYIDQIEELGDIGTVNMDKICKIVSKTRSLTEHNVRLLYSIANKTLTLYDATNLKTEAFETLALLNPNLERLSIHLCGQLRPPAIQAFSKLSDLTRLELHAPFLVTESSWIDFLLTKGPQLKGFLITNSPRFTKACLDVLVQAANGLEELRLAELTCLEDSWLEGIAQLGKLTSLDLQSDHSGRTSLSNRSVIDLLSTIGQNLSLLSLNGHEELNETVLQDGIGAFCEVLESLDLGLLPLLLDESVAEFFSALLPSNHLHHLDLSRCHLVSSSALIALLNHSGPTLRTLNLNGCKEVSDDALISISEQAPHLEALDIGWCRNVNDLVVGKLLTGLTDLKTLKVWGCNKITGDCKKRVGVTVIGVESDTFGRRT